MTECITDRMAALSHSTRSRFGPDAGNLDFEAAEVGVVVFADAVGEVDEAALIEAELGGARGKVPADGADGS